MKVQSITQDVQNLVSPISCRCDALRCRWRLLSVVSEGSAGWGDQGCRSFAVTGVVTFDSESWAEESLAPVCPHPNPPPQAGEGAVLFCGMGECARWKKEEPLPPLAGEGAVLVRGMWECARGKKEEPLPPFTGEGWDGGERRCEPFVWNGRCYVRYRILDGRVTGSGFAPTPTLPRLRGRGPSWFAGWGNAREGRRKSPFPVYGGRLGWGRAKV